VKTLTTKQTVNHSDVIGANNVDDYLDYDSETPLMLKEMFHTGRHGIAIFRFSYHVSVETHLHDFYEIQVVESGSSTQVINGNRVTLNAGDLCVFNKRVTHAIEAEEDAKIFHLVLDDKLFTGGFFKRIGLGENEIANYLYRSINQNDPGLGYIQISGLGDDVIELLNMMYYEYKVRDQGYDEILYGQLMILLNKANRYGMQAKQSRRIQTNITQKQLLVSKVLALIEDQSHAVTLQMIAGQIHLSPNYLGSILKEQTGRTFSALLQDARLDRVAFLLITTQASIEEIASKSGYQNMSYFYRCFKKKFDMTPKQYRKQATVK